MKKPTTRPDRQATANGPRSQPQLKRAGIHDSPLITKGRMLIGAAVMAAIAAIYVHGRDPSTNDSQHIDTVPSLAPQPEKTPEIVPAQIMMPQFEIHDGLEVSPFIKNSKIPPEQLREISLKVLSLIRDGITNFVVPEQRNHPNEKMQILGSFLDQVAGHMKEIHPDIAVDIDEITKIRETDMAFRLARYVNAYLLDQGYFLIVGSNDAGDTVNLYPVVKKKTVIILDNKGMDRVPAIYVGNGIQSEEKEGQNGLTPAPFADHVVVYASNIKDKAANGILEYYTVNNLISPSSKEQLAEDMEDDVVRHEATHAFIAHRFPHAEKKMLNRETASLNREIPIPGTPAVMPLQGEFPAMTLSELAAWGVQIGTSKSKVPYGHLVNFTESHEPMYALVNRLLPLATLQFAPESPLKSQIIEGILHSAVEFNDFRKLVVQPAFPHQNIQQSGMLMYQQAYTMIEELDGKMR